MAIVGTTTVTNAGTRVQIQAVDNRFNVIKVVANRDNTGMIYVGRSDVSASNGFEMAPAEVLIQDLRGSRLESDNLLPFSIIFVDAAVNGDKADWASHVLAQGEYL